MSKEEIVTYDNAEEGGFIIVLIVSLIISLMVMFISLVVVPLVILNVFMLYVTIRKLRK